MITYGRILSSDDYAKMSRVWIPPSQGRVFLVRIPDDWETLTQENHLEQMKLRLDWMMREWLRYNPDKMELQSMLIATLRQLHPTQEPPSLLDEDDEEKPLWAWAINWGESLLEFNLTWEEWFHQANPDLQYPIDLTNYNPPDAATEIHDEFTIEEFLTEMRTPFQ